MPSWAHAPEWTRLQSERTTYQYSDFPWPDTVTEAHPKGHQVAGYLDAYARHFGLLDCVMFGHRVAAMEYAGVAEEEVSAWVRRSVRLRQRGVADAEGHVQVLISHPYAPTKLINWLRP
jgi:dimethylaniline monooxygenase (N-oxide forming)